MISEDWSDTELIIFENGCVCLQRADQQTVEVHNITTSAHNITTCFGLGRAGGTHLYGVVRVQKHVFGADAAVHAAHAHEHTETEEVALVEVTHTVIQPGWTSELRHSHITHMYFS